eukprot:726573-Rhodomonas_salina.3
MAGTALHGTRRGSQVQTCCTELWYILHQPAQLFVLGGCTNCTSRYRCFVLSRYVCGARRGRRSGGGSSRRAKPSLRSRSRAAPVYGCTAPVYGCNAAVYGCSAAVYGCSAA